MVSTTTRSPQDNSLPWLVTYQQELEAMGGNTEVIVEHIELIGYSEKRL